MELHWSPASQGQIIEYRIGNSQSGGYQGVCTTWPAVSQASPRSALGREYWFLRRPYSLLGSNKCAFFVRPNWSKTMAREELKWQNIDADDLPAAVRKSFDAMVEAEATFKADLEKLLKNEGHMPEDKFLVMSRKGKRLGVAFASTPRGEGGAGSLKFKTK